MARIIWREPKHDSKNDKPVVESGNRSCEETSTSPRPTEKAEAEDKFEVRSIEDEAWYDAEVKFANGVVEFLFTGFNGDSESWTVEDLKSLKPISNRMRIVSTQLQDAECGNVSVNKRVCALKVSGKSKGWYDAVITEVKKRPHTHNAGGEVCTCQFTAVWQEGPGKGRQGILPSRKICLLSSKDVETHPLLLEILRGPNDNVGYRSPDKRKGSPRSSGDDDVGCRSSDKWKASPRSSGDDDAGRGSPGVSLRSSGDEAKRRESDTEGDTGTPDQLNQVRKFKRLKSKSTSSSPVNADVFDNAEFSEISCELNGHSAVGFNNSDLPREQSSTHFDCPGGGSGEGQNANKSTGSPSRTDRKDQLEITNFVSAFPKSCQEHPIRSKLEPSTSSSPDLHSPTAEAKLVFGGIEQTPGRVAKVEEGDKAAHRATLGNDGDPQELRQFVAAKVQPAVELNTKKQRPEMRGSSDEPHPSKKVRITLDIEVKTSLAAYEGLSDCVEKICEVSKGNACTIPSFKEFGKDGLGSSTVRSSNEQHIHPRSCPGLGSSGRENVICLSDEEVEYAGDLKTAPQQSSSAISGARGAVKLDPKTSGTTPSVSRGSVNPRAGFYMNSNERRGSNDMRSGDFVGNRNSLLTQLLKKSGCVLTIENLELGMEPADVLGTLLKFFQKTKVHSVHIPPPYPDVNHGVGYIVFMDKDTADNAVAFFTCFIVVSVGGRPWIVSRQGHDLNEDALVGFSTTSAFMGEVHHDHSQLGGGPRGELKVLMDREKPEYKAAKRRQDLFKQHRLQIRNMFQKHAQEEAELLSNPESIIYR